MEVVKQVIKAAQEKLEADRQKQKGMAYLYCMVKTTNSFEYHFNLSYTVYTSIITELEAQAVNDDKAERPPANQVEVLGEGGESGDIIGGKSLVFASLEVCLCVLVRHIPAINPALPSTRLHTPPPRHRFSEETCQLICTVLNIMVELPALCSHAGKCIAT